MCVNSNMLPPAWERNSWAGAGCICTSREEAEGLGWRCQRVGGEGGNEVRSHGGCRQTVILTTYKRRAKLTAVEKQTLDDLVRDIREFVDIVTSPDSNVPGVLELLKVQKKDRVTLAALDQFCAELRVAKSVVKPVFEWCSTVHEWRLLREAHDTTMEGFTWQMLLGEVCVRAGAYLRR